MNVLVTEPDWAPTNWDQVEERVVGRRLALFQAEQDLTEGPCDPVWFGLRIVRLNVEGDGL